MGDPAGSWSGAGKDQALREMGPARTPAPIVRLDHSRAEVKGFELTGGRSAPYQSPPASGVHLNGPRHWVRSLRKQAADAAAAAEVVHGIQGTGRQPKPA